MQKYKIEITQKEKYIVDVYAENQEQAEKIATEAFNNGDYQETGDIETDFTNIYDVTNTDDPFYPVNTDCKDCVTEQYEYGTKYCTKHYQDHD